MVDLKTLLSQIGLRAPDSWLFTIAASVVWLGLMLVYSPVADGIATRWIAKPPSLRVFGALQ